MSGYGTCGAGRNSYQPGIPQLGMWLRGHPTSRQYADASTLLPSSQIAAHEEMLRQKAITDKVYLLKVVKENNQRLVDRMDQVKIHVL